jgi:hypothetical protein
MTGRTPTGDRIRALREKAEEYGRAAKAAEKIPSEHVKKRDLKEIRDQAEMDATELKESGKARLEDLHVFIVKKPGGKKSKFREYWHAAWRNGDKVVQKYIGCCSKMSKAEAQKKARRLKAQNLQIKLGNKNYDDEIKD